jgi:hypothetical protein
MSVVDDFGRYYADPGLLRAACYPRQLNKVSDSDIGKWLTACVNAALVRVYPAQDGESYLVVESFGQQVRAQKSRFPDPPIDCAADAQQMLSKGIADAPVFGDVSVDEDVGEGVTRSRKRERPPAHPRPDDVSEQVWADWLSLRTRKRAPVTETVIAGARDEALKAQMPLEAFLRVWCLRGSQGLEASWLKPQEREAGRPPSQSYRTQELAVAQQRYEEAAGIRRPTPANILEAEVIDVTPRALDR